MAELHDDGPGLNIYAWHNDTDWYHLVKSAPSDEYWANFTGRPTGWDHIARQANPPTDRDRLEAPQSLPQPRFEGSGTWL